MCPILFWGEAKFDPLLFPLLFQSQLSASSTEHSPQSSSASAILPFQPRLPTSPHPSALKHHCIHGHASVHSPGGAQTRAEEA